MQWKIKVRIAHSSFWMSYWKHTCLLLLLLLLLLCFPYRVFINFYFHRLTPVYMFTILVSMYLAPYFGQGPFWQAWTVETQCPKYWWTNLLYINNFYPKNFANEVWIILTDFCSVFILLMCKLCCDIDWILQSNVALLYLIPFIWSLIWHKTIDSSLHVNTKWITVFFVVAIYKPRIQTRLTLCNRLQWKCQLRIT